nr:MAG TPA: hypothetical protein [Caudoviricetes sp.]
MTKVNKENAVYWLVEVPNSSMKGIGYTLAYLKA